MQTVPTTAAGRAEVRGADGTGRSNPLPRDADRRIDAIWSDFERVVPNLNQELHADGTVDQYSTDNMAGTWLSRSIQKVSHVSVM